MSRGRFIQCARSGPGLQLRQRALRTVPSDGDRATGAVVAGIAVSTALLFVFLKVTKRLSSPIVLARVGVLYEAYQPDRYWWEVVVMARRTLLTTLTLITHTADSYVSLVCVCIVISAVQYYTKPFRHRLENRVDFASLSLLTVIASYSIFTLAETGSVPRVRPLLPMRLRLPALCSWCCTRFIWRAIIYAQRLTGCCAAVALP